MIQSKSILQRLFTANSIDIKPIVGCRYQHDQSKKILTPRRVTEILNRNQLILANPTLPKFVKSIECNQLASNTPIEDRLRVSIVHVPGQDEPSLIVGVFDGHSGGRTADLISRRLFNYIALTLHPEPGSLRISNLTQLKNYITDLHFAPQPAEPLESQERVEIGCLVNYRNELANNHNNNDIVANLKSSFNRCDDDLSREIQDHLLSPTRYSSGNTELIHYYLSTAISGCVAAVMVIHKGMGYLASTGDCRAVEGIINLGDCQSSPKFMTKDLNIEHTCDNVNEIRRLAAAHPVSEQNTMIRHNRLLGHLMPFRAFGDFVYKWPADLIKACGITRIYGSDVIPSHYHTPPYLTAEPEVTAIQVPTSYSDLDKGEKDKNSLRCFCIASDGLWEFFESSRDVVEAISDHVTVGLNKDQSLDRKSGESVNVDKADSSDSDYDESDGYQSDDEEQAGYSHLKVDKNCATHLLRTALRTYSVPDAGSNPAALERIYHLRLQSMLSLPPSVARRQRDDISIMVLKV